MSLIVSRLTGSQPQIDWSTHNPIYTQLWKIQAWQAAVHGFAKSRTQLSNMPNDRIRSVGAWGQRVQCTISAGGRGPARGQRECPGAEWREPERLRAGWDSVAKGHSSRLCSRHPLKGLKKTKSRTTVGSSNSTPGYTSKDVKTLIRKNTRTQVFTSVASTTGKMAASQRPSTGGQVEMTYGCTTDCTQPQRKNEIMPFATSG